jgi:hypothetical protein
MVAMRVAALCACAVFLCGCGAKTGKHQTETVIAHTSAAGKHASATASSGTGHFGALSVRIGAAPDQRVSGGWVITCREGTAYSRTSKNFGGRTPFVVALGPSPTDVGCNIVALATLAGSGRVTVKLLGQ